MGISDADSYFGKVVFTGSHENAMLALAQAPSMSRQSMDQR